MKNLSAADAFAHAIARAKLLSAENERLKNEYAKQPKVEQVKPKKDEAKPKQVTTPMSIAQAFLRKAWVNEFEEADKVALLEFIGKHSDLISKPPYALWGFDEVISVGQLKQIMFALSSPREEGDCLLPAIQAGRSKPASERVKFGVSGGKLVVSDKGGKPNAKELKAIKADFKFLDDAFGKLNQANANVVICLLNAGVRIQNESGGLYKC